MTREQQRQQKLLKLQAQKQVKIDTKQKAKDIKAFDKAIERWKANDAWIED
jgi:hypothetical protein